jgi:hypothetical protein
MGGVETDAWDAWHYFPGTTPKERTGFIPCVGDAVELECRHKFNTIPGVPEIYRTATWGVSLPGGLDPPLPEGYGICRWKHLDPDTARRWREEVAAGGGRGLP